METTFIKKPLLFVLLFLTSYILSAQGGLVVNEISQGSGGSREYAELVVIGDPCTTVDLRGWIFDDNNGDFTDCPGPNNGALSGTGVAPGHMVFSTHPIWSEVPVGTIILLYAFDPNTPTNQANTGGYAPDYDYECDFRMVIPLNQSSGAYILEDLFFPRGPMTVCPMSQTCPNGGDGNPGYTGGGAFAITNSSWTGSGPVSMRNGGDAFQVRMPNATFFHGLSYGEGSNSCFGTPIVLTGGPDGLHINDSGGNKVYHFLNTTSDDYRSLANWSSGSTAANETPAEPNNCANAEWIASLRRPWESALNTGGGCMEPVENHTICIGETLTIDLPVNNSNCTSTYSSNISGTGAVSVTGSSTSPPFTVTGVLPGTVTVTLTATLTNQDLFSQGGCSGGNNFQQSLDYTFNINVTAGSSANDITINDCQDAGGFATINLTNYNGDVTSGAGQSVVWQHIVGGSLVNIPNPNSYNTSSTTVYAQVTDGNCTSEATVTIDLSPAPVPNDITLFDCDSGNGTVNWDLDAAANSIASGVSPNAVFYYLNSNSTNQINNTNPFVSGSTIIYATQATGTCESQAVPITLDMLPVPDAANISFVANPTSGCGSASVDVTFDINGGGCYDVVLNVGGTSVSIGNVSDGDVENFTFNSSGSIDIESVSFCNENCSLTPNPNPTIITLGDAPDLLAVDSPVTICAPGMVDLTNHITDQNTTGATITFHSASPATLANQLGSSMVSPIVNTTYYAFATLGPGCEDEEPIVVNVTASAIPMLMPATLCESDADLDLNTLEDPAYTNGTWSGNGVTGDAFDPSTLNGPIILTFNSDDDCVADAMTTITVTPANMANVTTPNPICNTDGLVDLTLLEDPAYSGSWTGPNVVGDMFDPSSYSNEDVMVQFVADAACTGATPTTIQIIGQATPMLTIGEICNNATGLDLTTLQDANYTTGTWSGAGVTGTNFDPSGISSPATVTFTSDQACVAVATTTIDILTSPSLINLVTDACNMANTSYEVSFDITGGTEPYTVNAVAIVGNTYSETFNTGDPYNFVIDDVNGCNPVMIDGTTNCACTTAAGTMNAMPGPLMPCINSLYDVNAFYDTTNEFLDGNDILAFILHDNAGTSLGTILEISFGGVFGAPTNVVPNQTYYVSAVVGNDDGAGSLDLNDPCLSVSQGLEIIFLEPSATLSAGGDVCAGDCYNFEVTFIGTAPFGFTYLDSASGVSTDVNNILDNPYSLEICSATTTNISITQVTDANCTIDIVNPDEEAVTVIPTTTSLYFEQLCEGDSIFVNGVLFNEDMLTGQVTFTNTSNGCDSIVDVTIAYTVIDTVFITETLCSGQELIVNGTPYNEMTPSGVEIAPASSGLTCDTTVVIDLTFSNAITQDENGPLCNGDTIFVNNIAYHAGNAIGQEIMMSQAGCDSIVNIDLEIINNSLMIYDDILCTGGSITVNGTVYDETNPSDTLLFENGAFNNCDSLIYIDLTFNTVVLNMIDTTICFGDTAVINGMEFHAANTSFSENFPLGSFLGCDSTYSVNVSFYNEVMFDLTGNYCEGEEVVVGMDVYDMNTPMGVTVLVGQSYLGCDSTVNVNLVFNAAGVNNIDTTICEGDQVEFFGQFYDCNTNMATETIPGGNWAGCDSIINLTINCNPESFFDFTTTICTGDTIYVNGTPYFEGSSTGVEVLPMGNAFLCDSTINVAISFSDFVSFDLIETICTTDSVIVNGTTYDFDNPTGIETIPMGSFLGCDSVINVNLSFFPLSTNLIDDTLCEGESIIVNGVTYDMDMPMGIEVIENGSANSCDSTITVDLTFVPDTEFNIDMELCDGETIEIGGVIYDEAITTSVVLPIPNFNGCDSTININLEFFEPSSFTLIETLPAGGSINVGGITFDATMPTGTVTLEDVAYTGCDSIIMVLLSFEAPVVAVNAVTPTCFGDNDGSLEITDIPSGVGPYDVLIESTGFTFTGDLPILIPNLSAGVYVITITDANGTEVEIVEVVNQATELSLDLGEDVTINMGDDYEFDPQFFFAVDSFAWTPTTYFENPDTLYPTAIKPGINTNYQLYLQDENGCFTTDDFTLIVNRERLVYIPNAFSPNGDGLNDNFTIFSNKGVAEIELFQVFDRWGNLLFQDAGFQPNNRSKGWNGSFNGQEMNPGVYVYYATILFQDGEVEVYKGDVTLMK